MKNFRMLSSAIVAAVAVVGFSAFKVVENKPVQDSLKWFKLTEGGNQANANDYELANIDGSSAPDDCPDGTVEKCGILAEPKALDPSHPNLSTEVTSQTIYRPSTQD